MKKFLTLVFILAVSSCANRISYDERLDEWLGKSEDELTSYWGIPDGSYEKEVNSRKTRYLTYSRSYNQYIPNVYNNTQPMSGHYVAKGCRTMFAIDVENDEVASWKYDGNGC